MLINKKVLLTTCILIALTCISTSGAAYYFSTKRTLTTHLKEKLELISQQIYEHIEVKYPSEFMVAAGSAALLDYRETEVEVTWTIDSILEMDSSILEVTIFNLDPVQEVKYGDYTYEDADDLFYIFATSELNGTVSYQSTIKGDSVYKFFTPVQNSSLPLVISLVTDYSPIRSVLIKQVLQHLAAVTSASFLLILLSVLGIRVFGKNSFLVTDNYVPADIEQQWKNLYVSIRGQRHDFLHHIAVLRELTANRQYELVGNYSQQLTKETMILNESLMIGDPILSAIIHSKKVESISRGIEFTCNFAALPSDLPIAAMNSLDLVKVIGNLIDNAMDALDVSLVERKQIIVEGKTERNYFILSVSNNGCPIPEANQNIIFQTGFSTKSNRHLGIGLTIVKGIVLKYKGTIHFESNDTSTAFTIIIPSKKGHFPWNH
ncbi:sensor histidine kinase [Paenibacillus koleovorans]|uniref:sensor histidine kinase n=1 Tax=Paenibacillus koleovorans TaxID=121608 RepID=UPI0013E35AD0|nr:ATP-binding protein [Paenibacillus koleovorans]